MSRPPLLVAFFMSLLGSGCIVGEATPAPGEQVAGGSGGGAGPAVDDCAMPMSLTCEPLAKMPTSIKDTGFFPPPPTSLNTRSA